MPTFEIVVLTYRRATLLARCLTSLDRAARRVGARVRTIVVINGSDPETESRLTEISNAISHLEIETILSSERLPCGFARNAGVEAAKATWIYFADDDAWVSEDLFEIFLEQARTRVGLAVIGGPNLTSEAMTPFQKTVGAVLSSPFAAGPFSRRYRAGGEIETAKDDRGLILCNLFVKRSALANYRFPAELSCAEENHMLHFLDSEFPTEGKIFHPALAVFHERAGDFARFASSALRYGRGRGELVSLDGWTMKSSKFFLVGSTAAIASLAVAPLAALSIYAVASIVHGVWITAKTRNVSDLVTGPVLTVALHSMYPLGVLHGILRTPRRSLRSMSAPMLNATEARSRSTNSRARSHD